MSSSRILAADVPALLYLHGLASSPKGRKKAVLDARFGPEGWEVVAPDLNVPSFRELSFDEMHAEAVVAYAEAKPRVVVGSSLGALVALSLADTLGRDGAPLVLVAPALGFGERWASTLPDGESFEMFHHGEERNLPIRRAFFEEMATVAVDAAPPPVPVSVVMGTLDETVPFEQVAARWKEWEASGRLVPGSRFHAVEGGDHGLVDFGDAIESAIRERLDGSR
jgi:pimeloyl-ACP methyl ester carboxylesterase